MTTISPRRRRNRPSLASLAAIFFVGVALLVVLLLRDQVGGLFWLAVTPAVSVRNSFDASENARLRAALASTSAALADRAMLYQQNLMLKAQLGRDANAHTVLAAVLMRPPGTPYDTLMLDAGAQQGIVKGSLVSAGGSLYIGTISDVYAATSRATLFSAPGSTYDALVLLAAQIGASVPVSLQGDGAGSMSAQVPSGTPVSVGDTVVVPGIAAAFTGVVSRVEKPAGDSFETLYVHLPIDFFSLQFVEVRLPAPAGLPAQSGSTTR